MEAFDLRNIKQKYNEWHLQTYVPSDEQYKLIMKIENFMNECHLAETPLCIDTLSDYSTYASFNSSTEISVDFVWSPSGLGTEDRKANPLEIKIIQGLISFMSSFGFTKWDFECHDYSIGLTYLRFSNV